MLCQLKLYLERELCFILKTLSAVSSATGANTGFGDVQLQLLSALFEFWSVLVRAECQQGSCCFEFPALLPVTFQEQWNNDSL